MNKKIIILIMSMLIVLLVGCDSNVSSVHVKERLVKVKTAEISEIAETIYYFGFIEPREVKAYALKTSGSVESINVRSGDKVEVGDVLVSLDDYHYGLGAQASSEQIDLAKLNLEKARKANTFYKELYNDSLVLYQEGAMSKQQADEIKLQYDISLREVEQAIKSLNQANIDYDVKSTSVDDTSLVSDMNGYVVDVFNEEGELVSQGYPVIAVRSEENVVKVGMSQEDVKRVKVGDYTLVEVDGITYKGEISNINLMPDSTSRTYTIEISLEAGDFLIGESCKVFIELEKVEGVWIDITDVMNDGVDYVYLAVDGRATRRDIDLHEINKSLVRVTNIEASEQIIVSGKNALSEGYKVKIEGEVNE